MNLRNTILQEHSKKHTVKIVNYIGNNQQRFDELIKLFLGNEYRVTQRAAWPLSYCVQAHPNLIRKHLKKIILNMKKSVHPAVKRNTVRFLQNMDIPENLQGITTDICFEMLNSKNEPIAVKVFSMTVLSNISKSHPGLSKELKLSIEAQLPYASTGFQNRANKILKKL